MLKALLTAAFGSIALSGCSAHWQRTLERRDGVEHCLYTVEVADQPELLLDVTAECRGPGVRGLAASQNATLAGLGPVTSTAGSLVATKRRFELARPERQVRFRYQVDLAALARIHPSVGVALVRGGSLLAPVSSFLLHPLPLDPGVPVEVRIRTPQRFPVTLGLERAGDAYRLQAHEIPVATYAVFGSFVRREVSVDDGRAKLELALLEEAGTLSADELAEWLKRSAEVISEFYAGFPAARTLVTVVPLRKRRGVVYGKLLPESAPGVVLFLGERSTLSDLARDKVLLHELFHIGVPSFHAEGKWFDEGLASYFAPLLQARATQMDESALWRGFANAMRAALPALTQRGLEHARRSEAIYGGGALFCLLADIEARESSGGRHGLQDGLRRVRAAGGHASEVWELERTLRVADSAFRKPILVPLAQRFAAAPARLDLDALFAELGVILHGDAVELQDNAPRAWVRQAITRGTYSPRSSSR